MNRIIRIGSRESALAVRQSVIIREQIEQFHPGIKVEIVTMSTKGDRILDQSLEKIGGKGLFVLELEQALLDGRVDIAVHSLKDLPMEVNKELPILAYGMREDPRDVLVCRTGTAKLPADCVIGTSSRRRKLQIEALIPGCTVKNIRGNVQTRLRKLEEEGFDATILAAAGLSRLGLEQRMGRILSVEEMIPAAGQGILAVQGRKGENGLWMEGLDDPKSRAEALAERSFIRFLEGGFTSPSAAHAQVKDGQIRLIGLYYDETTGVSVRGTLTADVKDAEKTGEVLAESLQKKAERGDVQV